jgi:hypothetical protein
MQQLMVRAFRWQQGAQCTCAELSVGVLNEDHETVVCAAWLRAYS